MKEEWLRVNKIKHNGQKEIKKGKNGDKTWISELDHIFLYPQESLDTAVPYKYKRKSITILNSSSYKQVFSHIMARLQEHILQVILSKKCPINSIFLFIIIIMLSTCVVQQWIQINFPLNCFITNLMVCNWIIINLKAYN